MLSFIVGLGADINYVPQSEETIYSSEGTQRKVTELLFPVGRPLLVQALGNMDALTAILNHKPDLETKDREGKSCNDHIAAFEKLIESHAAESGNYAISERYKVDKKCVELLFKYRRENANKK